MSDYWCLAPPPPIITCLSSGCCCSGKNCRTAGNWTAPLRLLFSGPSNPPREQTLPGSVSHTCQGLQHKGMHAEAGCISRLTASHFTGARLLHSMSGMGNFDGVGATIWTHEAAVACRSVYLQGAEKCSLFYLFIWYLSESDYQNRRGPTGW